MKLKALALASMLAISGNALAETASASLVWSGYVPGTEDGQRIKITGLNNGAIGSGTLIVANNGTFTSNQVVLESRRANALAGENGWAIGDLVNATWTLSSAQVNYGGVPATDATVVVRNNGTVWAQGQTGQITGTNNVNITVQQTTPIEVGVNSTVQAQVTVLAQIPA